MAQERRRHQRAICHIRVEYAQPGALLVARAIATNISACGMKALAPMRPLLDSAEVLPMTLFLEDGPVKVSGRMVNDSKAGFAVEFVNLPTEARGRLEHFVERASAFRR